MVDIGRVVLGVLNGGSGLQIVSGNGCNIYLLPVMGMGQVLIYIMVSIRVRVLRVLRVSRVKGISINGRGIIGRGIIGIGINDRGRWSVSGMKG